MRAVGLGFFLCLVVLGGCQRGPGTEIISAGMPKAKVRAILGRHGARNMNFTVGAKVERDTDWYVLPDKTCAKLIYDARLNLKAIILGSKGRGFHTMADWEVQSHTPVKQLYLD